MNIVETLMHLVTKLLQEASSKIIMSNILWIDHETKIVTIIPQLFQHPTFTIHSLDHHSCFLSVVVVLSCCGCGFGIPPQNNPFLPSSWCISPPSHELARCYYESRQCHLSWWPLWINCPRRAMYPTNVVFGSTGCLDQRILDEVNLDIVLFGLFIVLCLALAAAASKCVTIWVRVRHVRVRPFP